MAVIGLGKHAARLAALSGPSVRKAVSQVLQNGAEKVVVEAKRLITTGAVSGAGHVPSRPGEPPNNDTGVLAGNIEDRMVSWDLAEVSSNAPYAAIHEYGGTIEHPGGTPYFMRDGKAVFVSNKGVGAYHTLPKTKPHTITMPARPYMVPARDNTVDAIEKDMVRAIDILAKRSA